LTVLTLLTENQNEQGSLKAAGSSSRAQPRRWAEQSKATV